MGALDDYIQKVKKELSEKNITDELETIRYIYLGLGKNLSFNPKFMPFGTSRYRQNLYRYQSHSFYDLNKCMETHIAICKSIAYILRYVLSRFDIDVEVCIDKGDIRRNKHMYNVVTLKDGRKFILDLQEDIRNIQMNYYTTGFGIDFNDPEKYIITRYEVEPIDKKLDYISDSRPYADEYFYLLHQLVDGIESLTDKLEIVLENIDVYDTKHIGYTDRQWNHKRVLEEFFTENEFKYDEFDPKKIRFVDCHIDIEGKTKYICFVQVADGKDYSYFKYNETESKYERVTIEDIVNMYDKGMIVHKTYFYGFNAFLRNRKNNI